jgi:hypothetical protein
MLGNSVTSRLDKFEFRFNTVTPSASHPPGSAATAVCPGAKTITTQWRFVGKLRITSWRRPKMSVKSKLAARLGIAVLAMTGLAAGSACAAEGKKPNIVMLMQDDTGWTDFGAYLGGAALGHPTPNVDRLAKEGAMFTSWYGQASCTAGRASFITGRIPIRSALSIVVAPGDENHLRAQTPTIAEFFQKNGYQTYFSGKWHLGDKPESFRSSTALTR